LVVPPVLFTSLWWAGYWFFCNPGFIGVGFDGYDTVLNWISGIVALVTATVALGRMIFAAFDRYYSIVLLLGSLLLPSLVGVDFAHHFLSLIDGTSAEDAARNTISRWKLLENPSVDPNTPIGLKKVDPEQTRLENKYGRGFVSYIAHQAELPLMHIVVAPYEQRLWPMFGREMWHVVHVEVLIPSKGVWDSVERHWHSAPRLARQTLEQVIKQYPNTKAERRAQSRLERLRREQEVSADANHAD
jgi:hypothetical protein